MKSPDEAIARLWHVVFVVAKALNGAVSLVEIWQMREDLVMQIFYAYADLMERSRAEASRRPNLRDGEKQIVLRGADAVAMLGGMMPGGGKR